MASWNEILKLADSLGVRWIREWKLDGLLASEEAPSDGDRKVAWEVRVELQTRITTQKLNFLDGNEGTALTSVYNLFQPARELLKKEGLNGPRSAAVVELMLNAVVRPFTAEWHRRKLAGDLARDDATAEFRRELEELRADLGKFSALLHAIATGVFPESSVSPVPEDKRSKSLAESVTRSIPFDRLLGYPDSGRRKQSDAQAVAIVNAEQSEIKKRRQAVGQAAGHDDLVGMAISGGGIRSATFALGVVQGLAERGLFRQVDLLSTVSGGGYLGAFVSSMLNVDPPVEKKSEKKKPDAGKKPPKGTTAADSGEEKPAPVLMPDGKNSPFEPDIAGDSLAVRELRNHSRYILPSSVLRWLMTIGQAAYGVVSNVIILSVPVFVLVLLTAWYESCTGALSEAYCDVRSTKPSGPSDAMLEMSRGPFIFWMICLGLLALLPLVQMVGRLNGKTKKFSSRYEIGTALAFALALLVTAIEYMPLVHYGYLTLMHAIGVQMKIWFGASETHGWSLRATIVSVSSIIGMISARSDWLRKLGETAPRIRALLFSLLWLAGPALFVYAYFELCRVYVADGPREVFTLLKIPVNSTRFVWLLLVGSLWYSLFVNVNFTSLHRFYRNRLAETYLLRKVGEREIKSTDKTAVQQKLSKLRATPSSTAPYHLINAALNLPSSDEPELRGRGCDFFLFSKCYCGSEVTGYWPTTQLEMCDPHLDLGTAVAISGAAAAPQMGMGSIRGASFLLTLLNVRLGYWLARPDRWMGKLAAVPYAGRFMVPGPWHLMREAFNLMDFDANYLNVSDGGHIENLGLYELLKRRCKYIIAIDGECDPELDCPSLMRLQHFAKVDLGVEIDIEVQRLKWVEVTPAEAKPTRDEEGAEAIVRAVRKPTRFSRGHFAVGAIKYPPVEPSAVGGAAAGQAAEGDARNQTGEITGVLIYVKLSMTGNEPDYIHDYRRQYPEFPHQSTADQVFEDAQFEAYRGLGEHVAQDLFSSEVLQREPNDQNGDALISAPAWCRKLFETLHRPRFRDPFSL